MEREEIKAWRSELGLTQRELARILGVGMRTICRWEAGDSNPSPMAQKLIAEMKSVLAEMRSGIEKQEAAR